MVHGTEHWSSSAARHLLTSGDFMVFLFISGVLLHFSSYQCERIMCTALRQLQSHFEGSLLLSFSNIKTGQRNWRVFPRLSWSSLTFCLRKRRPISLTLILPIPFPKRNGLRVMVSQTNLPGELLSLKESTSHAIPQRQSLYFAANVTPVALEWHCISN